MSLKSEVSRALLLLEHIRTLIQQVHDGELHSQAITDLDLLIGFLENPIFKEVATIQDSLNDLIRRIKRRASNQPIDIDVTGYGEFTLNLPPPLPGLDLITSTSIEVLESGVTFETTSQDSSGMSSNSFPDLIPL